MIQWVTKSEKSPAICHKLPVQHDIFIFIFKLDKIGIPFFTIPLYCTTVYRFSWLITHLKYLFAGFFPQFQAHEMLQILPHDSRSQICIC